MVRLLIHSYADTWSLVYKMARLCSKDRRNITTGKLVEKRIIYLINKERFTN